MRKEFESSRRILYGIIKSDLIIIFQFQIEIAVFDKDINFAYSSGEWYKFDFIFDDDTVEI